MDQTETHEGDTSKSEAGGFKVNSVKDLEYKAAPVKVAGLGLLALAFSSMGIIYADLGTSPLYTLNGIWLASGGAPSSEDVLGGVSAIIWALTIVPLLKYVVFALEFGTGRGEGGPFALFMSLCPKAESTTDGQSLTTYTTDDGVMPFNGNGRLAKLQKFKWPLFVWTVFGTALTLSDGILTPAVSVTSAVGGIAVSRPSIIKSVVPISIAFLVVLFAIQRFGTHRIAVCFAPITFIWLLLLGGCGIYNITHHPAIFRAFDPSRAVMWFVRTKNYDYLSGVILCLTGSEAMFANLSQFNKSSIRIAFAGFVYPMLILTYLGQGARLSKDPSIVSSIFYLSIPGPVGGALYWIIFVFAILATATSQAMISGAFSVLHQVIGMQVFPPLRVHHTSRLVSGQIYIPAANWLLFIGTVAVVGGFGSSAALSLAYGFAVATVFIVTSTLIALSIPFVKNMSYFLGVAFLLFFGFVDALFWGASLKKVPHGAWFPLALGGILCLIMVFWAYCRQLESEFESTNSQRLTRLLVPLEDSKVQFKLGEASPSPFNDEHNEVLHTASGEREQEGPKDLGLVLPSGEIKALTKIPVMSIFHREEVNQGVPYSFAKFLAHYPALPSVVIFLTTRVVGVPNVPSCDRFIINKVRSVEGFYTVTMRTGYLDRTPPSTDEIVSLLTPLASRSASTASLAITRVQSILKAGETVSHVIPSNAILSKGSNNKFWSWVRRVLVEEVYARARIMWPDRVVAEDREK
nr:potassium uptake protein [Cryptococcus depauperatus CBS 7841]